MDSACTECLKSRIVAPNANVFAGIIVGALDRRSRNFVCGLSEAVWVMLGLLDNWSPLAVLVVKVLKGISLLRQSKILLLPALLPLNGLVGKREVLSTAIDLRYGILIWGARSLFTGSGITLLARLSVVPPGWFVPLFWLVLALPIFAWWRGFIIVSWIQPVCGLRANLVIFLLGTISYRSLDGGRICRFEEGVRGLINCLVQLWSIENILPAIITDFYPEFLLQILRPLLQHQHLLNVLLLLLLHSQ